MSWSYLAKAVPTTPLYQVRLSIGDTLFSDQQLQDEEILQFIGGRTSIAGACADACWALASKFSRSVTMKGGGSSVNYSDLAKAYRLMAMTFEQQAILAGSGLPYAGGISVADKINQEVDTDRVKPQFNIGLDDNDILPLGPAGNETEESTNAGQE